MPVTKAQTALRGTDNRAWTGGQSDLRDANNERRIAILIGQMHAQYTAANADLRRLAQCRIGQTRRRWQVAWLDELWRGGPCAYPVRCNSRLSEQRHKQGQCALPLNF